MIYKDYYKTLGVGKTATPAEIKKAYRILANKYHPDKTKGGKTGEEKFKEINEANEVLSDPLKRKKYDQFGADWKHYEDAGAKPGGFDWSKYAGERGGQPRHTNANTSASSFNDTDIGDIFEMLFGQQNGDHRGRRSVVVKGEDLNAETTVSLEEAYHGTTRLIQLNNQTIKVTIKPGVVHRQTLRIAGKGGVGVNGGSSGDIFLTINIETHVKFQRIGNDLHCELPVDLYTAVLGGKTSIKTMKGTVSVTIPKGTRNGKELSLHGLGMPVYGSKNEFGDLLVKVNIMVPDQLSDEEVELFKKLSALKNIGHAEAHQ